MTKVSDEIVNEDASLKSPYAIRKYLAILHVHIH